MDISDPQVTQQRDPYIQFFICWILSFIWTSRWKLDVWITLLWIRYSKTGLTKFSILA